MPYQSRNAGRLADLIMRQGDIAADRAQRSGDVWADVARGLGSIPAGIQAQRAAAAEAVQKQRLLDSQMADAALRRRNTQGEIDARARTQKEQDEARTLAARTQKVTEWLGDVASAPDPETQQASYRAGRERLVADGTLTAEDAPDFFPGQSWVKSRMAMLLPAAERFKQLFPEEKKPEGFTLGPGQQRFDATGQPLASVPAPTKEPETYTLGPGQVRYGADGKVIARGPAQQQPATEPGWKIQTVTNPTTNETRMVRVNERTGEVQPVQLPEGMQPGGQRAPRLTAGQQDDLATMKTVEDLINGVTKAGDEIGWKGVGALWSGSVNKAAMNLGLWGTEKEERLRNDLSNIQATIAKLRGGTSFTVNEQQLLEQYTPTINDGDARIKAKLKSLANFIQLKRKNTLEFAGGGVAGSDDLSWTSPDGQSFTFPTKAALDAFKRDAGVP